MGLFVNLRIGTQTGVKSGITNAIISTSIRHMDRKLSRVVDLGWGNPTHKGTWHINPKVEKLKTLYLRIHKVPQNLAQCWLRMRRSHPKSHVKLNSVVTSQFKNLIFSQPKVLWPPNLAGWALRLREVITRKAKVTLSRYKDVAFLFSHGL